MKEPTLVQLNDQEVYFPQRLIYRVDNLPKLIGYFSNLSCIFQAPNDDRWYLGCSQEMMEMHQWSDYYIDALYKNKDPIVVGIIRIPDDKTMHVYLRSFERVSPTLDFLDKYIPRDIAIGSHHDSCYKVVTGLTPESVPTPEDIFVSALLTTSFPPHPISAIVVI